MKENPNLKNVKKVVSGWATSYAEDVDAKVREMMSNYADDMAHAVYKYAVSLAEMHFDDIASGETTPAAAKREFKDLMKEFYSDAVDGAQID